jgi:hypothetical protein
MTKEELKQALEALKNGKEVREGGGGTMVQPVLEDAAIAAIKAALTVEQEPVAFFHLAHAGFYWAKPTTIDWPQAVDAPPLALYTSPPKRPWVGLTDDEIDEAVNSCRTLDTRKYFRAIEAKLKEKNT